MAIPADRVQPSVLSIRLPVHHFLDLLGGDADRAVERDAHASEERREQVALIGFRGHEPAGFQRATAAARDDEGKIFAGVVVAVLEAGTPHHDAVVEECAVTLLELCHPVHHVSELGNVEGGDGRNLGLLLGLVLVVGVGVVFAQADFGIGHAIRCRADVRADARGVGLEGEHIEVAHHLHVFAAFVANGDFDLDGRRIRRVALARADARFFKGGIFLTLFNRSNSALDRTNAVEVLIELVLVVLSEFFAEIAGAADDQIEHAAVEGVVPGRRAGLVGFAKQSIEHIAGIDLRGHRLRGRAETAMRIVPFVQPFLILLVRLRHRRQFERGQRGQPADVVRRDLIGGDGDVDLVAMIGVRQRSRQPRREFQRVRGAVERLDRHTGDALDHEALIQHGAQGFDGRWWRRQELFRAGRPELIHDHAVRHVHESQSHRRLGGLALGVPGPANGVQQGQCECGPDPLQTGTAVGHGVRCHDWSRLA